MDKLSEMQQELNETMLKIKILFEKATPASYDGPKLPKPFIGDEPVHPSNIKPVSSCNEPKKENADIQRQIDEIRKEKIPKERDTALGRKSWEMEQKKRIQDLKNQLK